MKIACVGDCGVDRYLPSNSLLPGGITANFTRQARRCFKTADKISIISMVGNGEPEATVALAAVRVTGIDCFITVHPGTTPVQYIEITKSGEKNFTRYEPGILGHFDLDVAQRRILKEADLVMTPVYWQIHNVFEKVLASDITGTLAVDFSDFSTDPDFDLLEQNIEKIDIAFFGLNHHQTEMIDRISKITEKTNKLMVITLGDMGSIAIKGNKKISRPALPVDQVVDTTGAGDAFAAGFLSSYMHDQKIDLALEKGAVIAAETIQHVGSVPN
ncbi:MAG: hypothetical protein KDF58_05080 [Alphaproteobacteria bacterium]|nr:hypothetical protein [Alphaproteobacteria bacterium]HPF45841.1 PfkB family carbohydrate kinase [Emcibacteraceae bacterium]HRW29612.1 PfkB family carbohydrate kinase [Emcibacteraceae bacterium]